jgi:hypothetical protein
MTIIYTTLSVFALNSIVTVFIVLAAIGAATITGWLFDLFTSKKAK